MSSTTSGARETEGGRLGGARADFVASLGRKVGDARELLAVLEDDIGSRPARDELRRRIHALGSGARLLRFDAMARTLQEALAALDRSSDAGSGPVSAGVREQELAFVAQVLDDLPALAWGETPARDSSRSTDEGTGSALLPVTILVVGTETLADALTDGTGGASATGARSFECERTEDVATALELARAYAPDLVVVDVDIEGAGHLVEALLDDPLTEPVPLVVLGAFTAAEDSARYVALGVSKALTKPATIEALRGACDEILDARDGRTMRITLGEPTLEQLAERLVEELKRALVEAVDKPARSYRVPLGEGTEVVGALWGAIARIQEIVTQKTGGKVRFGGDAPEGAVALAPWLHQDLPGSERMVGRGPGAGADVRLRGRRVVVADDDPGVTWFISDLLRTAGCEVHEALDGATALDLAFRMQPELVVSDILMPNLDGFALCRALRRDVALRDTPVILLSWKEDLLQRVRELGASAAAYMRKESDSRSILARVREVLRPRARIEARLRGSGEVRGRLDGLSPRLLLELVGVIRGDARVTVRDATCLFEIEIRGGAPRKATRTASDGGYRSGERALGSLLAVGAGRFVVTPSSEPVRADLSGSLFEILARPVAGARGALAAIAGANTVNVERIGLDADTLEDYLRATPEPARTVVQKIAAGASPRQMLLGGEIAPSLLEDVLSDLASRDTLRLVEGPGGVDLLTPAVESALAVLRGGQGAHRSAPPPARPPSAAPAAAKVRSAIPSAAAPKGADRAASAPARVTPAPRAAAPRLEPVDDYDDDPLGWPSPDSIPPPEPKRASLPTVAEDDDDATMPSSLEDAVMRELSDRSPAPGTTRPGSDPPPLIEPSALKRRSSNPPEEETSDEPVLPSIPPDAIVPGAASSDEMVAATVAHTSEPPPVPAATSGRIEAAAKAHSQEPAPPGAEAFTSPLNSPLPPAAAALVAPPAGSSHEETVRTTPPARPAKPSRPGAAAPTRSRSGSSAGLFMLGLAFLAGAAGLALRTMGSEPEGPAVSATESAGPPPAAVTSASAGPAASSTSGAAAASAALAPTTASTATTDASADDLPPGAEVPPGYGLIEVAAPAGAHVRIDGAIVGKGPAASGVAAPGYHDVRVENAGHESKSVIEVRAGKVTRVESTLLP